MNTLLAAQDVNTTFGYLPLIVLGVYLVMLLSLGLYGYLKSQATEEDYYLAGRRQGFMITALTIMATFFSASAMLAVPGVVYKEGAVFVAFALNLPLAGAAVYLLGSRIARLGRAKGYVTPADMVAEYYDNSTAVRALVAMLGCLYVVPYVVIQMRAGGHLAQQMFPGASTMTLLGLEFDVFSIGTSVLAGVMMVYILVGGMRSVALADVVQGSLLLVGMLVAGFAAISALGGVSSYAKAISNLPPEALSLPGATGRYTAWSLLTVCVFASLASMIQPAQWMRYYAARSTHTLKRSALIFSIVLPVRFLFGVMLVGLGARALYPPALIDGVLAPHPEVVRWDQALVAVLRNFGPEALGAVGALLTAVIMVAILAASMSTADSNLHALSAVVTRDVYDRFRPQASQRERTWVGRGVIVTAALLALWLVQVGEHTKEFEPLRMIVEMQFVAIAFACQVLPVTIDILFVRRGTRAGAVAGMIVGLAIVLLFTPLPSLLLGSSAGDEAAGAAGTLKMLAGNTGDAVAGAAGTLKKLLDIGFCGFVVNAAVFAVVSLLTKKPDPGRVAEWARIMRGE